MHVPADSPFFNRTYNEAFNLLIEARNYMAYVDSGNGTSLGCSAVLNWRARAMRVTARLTQVMAWFLMQRAVSNGEMTLKEAYSETNRLSGDGMCLDNNTSTHEIICPPAFAACSIAVTSFICGSGAWMKWCATSFCIEKRFQFIPLRAFHLVGEGLKNLFLSLPSRSSRIQGNIHSRHIEETIPSPSSIP